MGIVNDLSVVLRCIRNCLCIIIIITDNTNQTRGNTPKHKI